MADEIVNKVTQSGLIQFDLEDWIREIDFVQLDISEFLFEGFLLKEKDFRKAVKEFDWTQYQNKTLILTNTDDAIITTWALMLIASEMKKVGGDFYFGEITGYYNYFILQKIMHLDLSEYTDARMIIKGCGKYNLDENLYTRFIHKIQPVAKSIMFGEACSSVPVFKKK